MKIYIEEFVAINSLMYWTFLFLTCYISKFETSKFRLIAGSLIGGITSLLFSSPNLSQLEIVFLQIVLCGFLASFLVKNLNAKKFVTTFFIITLLSNIFSFILAGCKKLIIKNNTIISSRLPTLLSLAIIFLIFLILKFLLDLVRQKLKQTTNLIETELEYKNKKIKTIGLVDTGNNLCFKNSPVSFINFEIFSKLTGISLTDFLSKNYCINNSDFVNVNSLAGTKKLLLIKLNKIKLKIQNKYQIIENPQVAVSLKINKKDYKMILNHNIL